LNQENKKSLIAQSDVVTKTKKSIIYIKATGLSGRIDFLGKIVILK
jgi:hypothetical protein